MTNDLKTKIAEQLGCDRDSVDVDLMLQAIHDAGYAVVPLVPTEAMIEAVMGECLAWECFQPGERWELTDVWAAMISTSQPKGEGE